MKLTVEEYAKQFKMSKEIVHSRLRLKKLDCVVEDDIVYILVDEQNQETKEKKVLKKPKTTVGAVIALYQRENIQLKEKIMQLELKIDKLIDDKEQMLRNERDKIEELYSKKDAQLKTILELVNTKMMLESKNDETIHEVQTLETNEEKSLGKIELKEYLKTLNLKSYQKKVIKRRFLAVYDSDIRIMQKDGKLYLDFSKYDYSDLLSH